MSNSFGPRRGTLAAALALCTLPTLSAVADAQVGFRPESSPYRPLPEKYQVSVTGGYSWGSGGKVGVGPANGPVVGGRFDLRLAGPGYVNVAANLGTFDRLLIDPRLPPDERNVGTATQSVVMIDAGLNLAFTGQKSWRGVVPYLGTSLGMAFGGSVPEDSLSGFEFGAKFMVTPLAGLRLHPTRRLSVRVEARDAIWKLSYPQTFFDPPTEDPDVPPVLDPAFNKESEWTHNFMLFVSLGWSFGR
jgi:hypothetical protein